MIDRIIQNQVVKALKPAKVVGIFGPRRSGKTTLMNQIKGVIAGKVLVLHGENLDAAEALSSQRTSVLEQLVAGYDYLFIDEAQKIPNIGINLKLMVDTVPNVSILVSGSSAFDLKNKIGEPLVGRSHYFYLYPLSQLELNPQADYLSSQENLENYLIYGAYPQVITTNSTVGKIEQLESIRNGYLLRDILEMDNLKDSLFIFNLLRLVAFQIGNDISYAELATNLNANSKTVRRYLEMLKKSYVLFSLPGFSRNLRKEYTKTPRYYFWDNGMRNAVVNNFNNLNARDDVGRLWENYCISERMKMAEYTGLYANRYFWRTYDQKEIDLVEERGGQLFAYEFKWRDDKAKPPKEFLSTYPGSEFSVVNKNNFLGFLS